LAAGAEIDEHVDGGLCYEVGEARMHIPVRTNPEVDFRLNRQRVVMREGSCWYINANMAHSVANRGQTARIHLVIDCGVNDWLREIFEANKDVK
jgi:mannose-6-phosphate isomerase-like protein (cupin superfamily)